MTPPPQEFSARIPGITLASLEEIQVNPFQPRREFDEKTLEELAQSIRANGLIQPLVVRKTSDGYQLIAGERRLRASKMAGLKQVPVVVRRTTDRESLELAIIENVQRENLNCVDEALAYFQLVQEFELSQEDIGVRVGKDRSAIANHLRLLKLPDAIIDDLKRGVLTFGHGKVLLSLEDHALRLKARAQIVEKHLSVREAEILVEQLKQGTALEVARGPAPIATPLQSRLQQLSVELTRQFSARVEVKGTERRGKIVLSYATRQELDRILSTLQNGRT